MHDVNLLWISFLAGILTILAPCIFSLLPVILAGSLGQKNHWRPFKIALSLGVSVLLFSLLLKGTSVLLPVPNAFWKILSGVLVTFVGLTMVWPKIWEFCASRIGLYKSKNLITQSKNDTEQSAYLLGAALGPVFASCSPTYSLILAVILPKDFLSGSVYLAVYVLGLISILLLIGYTGHILTKKLRFAVNPKGWFKRILGIILIIVGISIITGVDKKLETWILNTGYLGPIQIEQSLLNRLN